MNIIKLKLPLCWRWWGAKLLCLATPKITKRKKGESELPHIVAAISMEKKTKLGRSLFVVNGGPRCTQKA
jgi:hypothetical protein